MFHRKIHLITRVNKKGTSTADVCSVQKTKSLYIRKPHRHSSHSLFFFHHFSAESSILKLSAIQVENIGVEPIIHVIFFVCFFLHLYIFLFGFLAIDKKSNPLRGYS